jgi:hypothetical protein
MTALRLTRALLRDADFVLLLTLLPLAYVLAAGLACLMEI